MDQPSAHILFLDLATGACRREPLSPARRHADGGGRSLAGACFLAAQPDGAAGRFDAPATPVCLFPGGLAGYGLPGASFATLVGRSPHTGGVLTAAVPGGLGHGLARAGLAGLVLTGRAAQPNILVLDGRGARLIPAGALAGQGTRAVFAALAPWLGAVAVGPAGWSGSLLAMAVADGVHPVGRGGSGLLLAAKNLLAVVVTDGLAPHPAFVINPAKAGGTADSADVPELAGPADPAGPADAPGLAGVADPAGLAAARAAMLRLIDASPALAGPCGFGRFGPAALLDLTAGRRMLPTRHFRQTFFAQADQVSAPRLEALYAPRAVGCPGCPVPCRRVSATGAVLPDNDALSHLTALLGLADPHLAVAANTICLDLGLDPPGAAAALAFFAEVAGREPRPEMILDGLSALAREGAGATLSPLAVKGVALPGFDPRGAYGLALSLAVGTSGPDPWGGLCLAHELLRKPVATDRFTFAGKARAVFLGENVVAAAGAFGGCPYCTLAVGLEEWALAVAAVTGVPTCAGDLARLGERTVVRERLLNAQAGMDAAADQLPGLFFSQAGSSGDGINVAPLSRPDFLAARAGYYRLRGLTETGAPTDERASALELPCLR
ncbi:aldehyde ferredoxin oxidoreductase [Desulfovibrio aerotolerans]|uniref:Aldehyde ferredoxin oxidoreductase n=1 Tax=Solidesulfovibrio aerotolerans TaxID=295255 RepID=A0A7C9J8I8_9BACT|nr:aldehyde ferredoxin oxidoreductase C-terminal domain-containing protein [Solidesulfovibrio aerotolerans]MYL82838.1 aldehyde ferredoxin oxidoreductase [Solidesulfovibrio aerotolerans]